MNGPVVGLTVKSFTLSNGITYNLDTMSESMADRLIDLMNAWKNSPHHD